jgi:DNA-directed RNA polymerase specialized sigma24 family protein
MEIVKDVQSFVQKNENHLLRFFKHKTGICDRELIHDHLQEFYIKLIQTKALESYNEKEGAFDSYIFTLLCWLLPQMAKKNVAVHYDFLTEIKILDKDHEGEDDVWDRVSNFGGLYHTIKAADSLCTPCMLNESSDELFNVYVEEFESYLRRTEKPTSANQMIVFLKRKQEGCNSSDIARVLGVSDNMVKIIKKKLQRLLKLL